MFLSGFGIRISLANEISLEVFLSLLFFWKSLMVEFTGEAVWSWTFLFFGCAGSWLLWGLFSSCSEWGLLCSCGAQASRCGGVSYCWAWALGHTGSVVAVWGLNKCGSQALEFRLDSCDTWALLLRGMWDLPRLGIEPWSPALTNGFFTTESPGKPPGRLLLGGFQLLIQFLY